MKGAFDLFGKALLAYTKGDKSKFYFQDSDGNQYREDISKFFRKNRAYYPLERKIVDLSYGNILDVGCGTGGFLPGLMKKGKVLGIDNSKIMIDICKKRNLKNVKVADIFNFKPKEKFDTICLLDENIGLAATPDKTKILLKKLSNMLNENGQILANIPPSEKNYSIWKARCVWKKEKGPYFRWIRFNQYFLTKICKSQKLNLEVIARDGKRFAVKITKL